MLFAGRYFSELRILKEHCDALAAPDAGAADGVALLLADEFVREAAVQALRVAVRGLGIGPLMQRESNACVLNAPKQSHVCLGPMALLESNARALWLDCNSQSNQA